MRPKRRDALPFVSLFDPPPQIPWPGPIALEEAQNLLKRLLLHLAEHPEADEAELPSSPDHQSQDGRGQAGERQADGPESDALNQMEPCFY